MRLDSEERTAKTSGVIDSNHFTIKASPIAFGILSKNLYSDSYLAVVRELSTNAWDAHIEAGKQDIPFDVYLPTKLNPNFKIRDYGTGLPHKDVMTLYSTYFDSTRNKSNEAAGAYGLGSKSPFGISDNYMVTSYFNNKATTYSLMKDEFDLPKVECLGEEDTDEPNGLEVEVPVDEPNFPRIIQAAEKIYKYFVPRPNIGGYEINWPEDTPLFEGPGWKYYDQSGESVAIMGPVSYPIRHRTQRGRVEIWFDIGELSLSTGREELHYDDKTEQAIQKKKTEISEAICQEVQEIINKAPTYWDARIETRKFTSALTAFGGVAPQILYNDRSITNTSSISLYKIDDSVLYGLACSNNYQGKRTTLITYNHSFPISHKSRIAIDDINHSLEHRLRAFMRLDTTEIDRILVLDKDKKEDISKILKATDYPEDRILNETNIVIPKKKRERNLKPKVDKTIRRLVPIARSRYTRVSKDKFFERVDEVPTKGTYVFTTSKDNLIISENLQDIHPSIIVRILRRSSDLGMTIGDIHAVRLSKKKLVEQEGWKPLAETIREKTHNLLEENNLTVNDIKRVVFSGERPYRQITDILELLDHESLFRKSREELMEIREIESRQEGKTIKALRELTELIDGLDLKETRDINLDEEKIDSAYPLLKRLYIPIYGQEKINAIKEIADYINLVDKERKRDDTSLHDS